ncbi:MAG: GHKL domain-containing protein [Defluviitaleaceae bacterium]|nr:GHKL domain-containing protein [Defluviitaleaceae bacterium]
MDSYIIIFVISQFFLVLVSAKIIGVFYEKRRTSFKAMSLSLLAVYLVNIALHLLVRNHLADNEMLSLIGDFTFIAGCFVISLNYKSTMARRLAAIFTAFFIIVLSFLPMAAVVHILLPNLRLGSAEWIAVTNLGIIPIAYFMATLISRFKNIRKKAVFPRIALIAPLSATFALLMFFGAGLATIFGVYIRADMFIVAFFAYLALMIFSSLVLFDTLSAKYEEKLNSERQAQEKEYYYTQCQMMQETAEQVKAARHDIKIHLATLKGFATNGSMGDIKSYLDNLVEDINKGEAYSDTSNIAFDSIINYKLRNAEINNIKLDLNVAVPPELNVEISDIVTIFGNLLDNALEAVEKVNEKIIKLDIKFSKGTLFAKIENSFNGKIRHGEGAEESEIVSLKSGSEHGYGLKNIKQSIEKYNGHMKISYTETVFSVGVFLYVEN